MIMKKEELKRKMIESSIEKHKSVIDDFSIRIKELRHNEMIFNEWDFDLDMSSYNYQALNEANLIADQLEFANEELEMLYNIKPSIYTIHDQVELGAVVETNRQTFFISASIEHFKVEGKEYIGLSTKSPLYLTMEGLKKGDHFEYNSTKYLIKDIF